MDIDDYVFEVIFEDPSTYNNNSSAQKLRTDVQKNLAKLMAEKFQMFPKAMIDTHGKDMLDAQAAAGQNGAESPAASGTSTPVTTKAATTATPAASTVFSPAKKEKVAVSSAVVRTEGEFMAVRALPLHSSIFHPPY